jgi:hypothetical protein
MFPGSSSSPKSSDRFMHFVSSRNDGEVFPAQFVEQRRLPGGDVKRRQ